MTTLDRAVTGKAPTIFDVVVRPAPPEVGAPAAPEPEVPEPEAVVVPAEPADPAPPVERGAERRARLAAERAEARAVRQAAKPGRRVARRPAKRLVEVAREQPVTDAAPVADPIVDPVVHPVVRKVAQAVSSDPTRTLDRPADPTGRRTTAGQGRRPLRHALAQAVAALCLLCATVLVVSALLLVAQANESNALVTFVDGLAGHLDLGAFDVDNGVMKFDGVRADLKNALFNRGLCALLWVLVARVAERVIGGRSRPAAAVR